MDRGTLLDSILDIIVTVANPKHFGSSTQTPLFDLIREEQPDSPEEMMVQILREIKKRFDVSLHGVTSQTSVSELVDQLHTLLDPENAPDPSKRVSHADLYDDLALHIETLCNTKCIEVEDGNMTLEELGINRQGLRDIVTMIDQHHDLRIDGLTLEVTMNQLVGIVLSYRSDPPDDDSDEILGSREAVHRITEVLLGQYMAAEELAEKGVSRAAIFKIILEIFEINGCLADPMTKEDEDRTFAELGFLDRVNIEGIFDTDNPIDMSLLETPFDMSRAQIEKAFEVSLENITLERTLGELVTSVHKQIFN